MAVLLHGAGLRLLECARLRVNDIDFAANQIAVPTAFARHYAVPRRRSTRFASSVYIELASIHECTAHRSKADGHDGSAERQ